MKFNFFFLKLFLSYMSVAIWLSALLIASCWGMMMGGTRSSRLCHFEEHLDQSLAHLKDSMWMIVTWNRSTCSVLFILGIGARLFSPFAVFVLGSHYIMLCYRRYRSSKAPFRVRGKNIHAVTWCRSGRKTYAENSAECVLFMNYIFDFDIVCLFIILVIFVLFVCQQWLWHWRG